MLHAYVCVLQAEEFAGVVCELPVGKDQACGKPATCAWGACGPRHCIKIRGQGPSDCAVHASPMKPRVVSPIHTQPQVPAAHLARLSKTGQAGKKLFFQSWREVMVRRLGWAAVSGLIDQIHLVALLFHALKFRQGSQAMAHT